MVAACGISCCKNVKNNFVSFCGICVLSLKCRVLSRFVARCVECRGGCVWVFLVGFPLLHLVGILFPQNKTSFVCFGRRHPGVFYNMIK